MRGLRKRYGRATAVDGVSFQVRAGEIIGLLGPNGAGKTTTISMILGVLEPTEGALSAPPPERMNFAAAHAPLPGNLTVAENLRVFSLIFGVPRPEARVRELMRRFDLERFASVKAGLLSSGEQTRLGLAKALLNEPRLLLLDEPTASLDPATARDIRAEIMAYAARGEAGVLWTSHNMSEMEEVCGRVLFLSRGRVLLEGDPRALPAERGCANLEELFVAVAREPLTP